MTSYILRRLLLMVPTLVGITFLIFMIMAMAPGGIGAAVQAQAGGTMQSASGVAIQRAYLEDRYGLNDHVLVQYGRWLTRMSPIKFGVRDQVLPNGELVRVPRELGAPTLYRWFVEALAPEPTAPDPATLAGEDQRRVELRRLQRAYDTARAALIEADTNLKSELTAYARATGLDVSRDAVLPDGLPRLPAFDALSPDRGHAAWPALKAKGDAAITAYNNARAARAELVAFFRTKPFDEYGLAIIPGAVSLAWPDLGTAFSSQRPVAEIIPPAMLVTLTLNLLAIPIIYLVAVPTGILAAVRKGGWVDLGLGSVYIMLYSVPVVLMGVICIGFLANREYLGWFPTAGLSSLDEASIPFLPGRDAEGVWSWGWVADRLWHMALPVFCLVYTGFAVLSKQTRAAMLENFSADYVRTAKAKGVSGRDVIFRHVFRNSLLPLITIFVLVFPAMLAGSVVVERVFSIPGMGSELLQAINNRDAEVILANTTMIALVNVTALLLADILYALADPRVAYD